MRVLLIEDEEAIARAIRRSLERIQCTVDVCHDGAEGLEMALKHDYNAIVLDLMLPGKDGWQICAELRSARRRTPILMLTARGSVPDRVRGLDAGADDYLAKPFDYAELQARVLALDRREKLNRPHRIKVDDLMIDTDARRVVRGDREITLSQREFQLLEALATHQGQALSREAIQKRVWMDEGNSNMVDVYIRLLRKKVDAVDEKRLIDTVRGVGYALRWQGAEAFD